MAKPTDFAAIPALDPKTQLYTQRRTDTEAPTNYRFSVEELAEFLALNFDLLVLYGAYKDDLEAGDNGVPIGGGYRLTPDNYYGMPEGIVKVRLI
jgi:hypothetical protein